MAEKKSQMSGDRERHANDDPFAELSRIIGFSPSGGGNLAGNPAQSPSELYGARDDLELEMERELLGSFAADPRPLPVSGLSAEPVVRAVPVASPVAAPVPGGPAAEADDDDDDLGIALDLDAELAASLRENSSGSDAEESVDFASLRGANSDELPAQAAGPSEESGPQEPQLLDEAELAELLQAEFDVAGSVSSVDAEPDEAVEVEASFLPDVRADDAVDRAAPGVAAPVPELDVALDDEAFDRAFAEDLADLPAAVAVSAADDAGEPAAVTSADASDGESEAGMPDLADDEDAEHADSRAVSASVPAIESVVVQAAVAGMASAPVVASVAPEAIALPGSPSMWRAQMHREPVASHVPAVNAAPPVGHSDAVADVSFEDELAAAFGEDILSEARQSKVARQVEEALDIGLDLEDLRAVARGADAEPPLAVDVGDGLDAAGDDVVAGTADVAVDASDPARSVEDDLAVVTISEADDVAPAPAGAGLADAGPDFDAVLAEGFDLESETMSADEATVAPVHEDPAVDGALEDVSAVEPVAASVAHTAVAVDEVEPALQPYVSPPDLDRQLAASLEAEFSDADLFSDLELDISEPEMPAAVVKDVVTPAHAYEPAEIDFDAAMAEVDANFSDVPHEEIRAYEARDAATAMDDATAALEHDLDDLLVEMKAQTGHASPVQPTPHAAAQPAPVVAASALPPLATPGEDDFSAAAPGDAVDVFGDEDLFGLALREAADSDAVAHSLDVSLTSTETRPDDLREQQAEPEESGFAGEPDVYAPVAAARDVGDDWNDTRLAAAFSDLQQEGARSVEIESDTESRNSWKPAAAVAAASSAMMAAPAPAVPSTNRDDPFAALAAMAARYKRSEPMTTQTGYSDTVPVARQQNVLPAQPAYDDDAFAPMPAARYAHDDMPDIETVEVSEAAFQIADDLDIPDLTFEDEPAVKADSYDDLDDEFSSLLSDMSHHDRREAALVGAHDVARASETAPRGYAAAAIAGAMASQAHDLTPHAVRQPAQPVRMQHADVDAEDFDPVFDEDLPLPAYEAIDPEPRPRRRGFFLASLLGGVALIGGVAAFALTSDNVGSGAPTIVKADAQPIKVRPENPGGTVVPHQDNKVYETVAGKPDTAPAQQALLTSAEAPMDIAAAQAEEGALPLSGDEDIGPAIAGVDPDYAPVAPVMEGLAGKNEERVAVETATAAEEEIALVEPRRVRTMIVKPDGTLVPREDPPEAAEIVPASASAEPAAATEGEPAFTIPGAETAEEAAPPADVRTTASTPAKVPVAPSRPADQPVDIVGGVRADQVASISTGGEWAMQIASQPSQEGAQAEYASLAKRYAKVLKGQPVNIVRAEIEGKGTFWRVRVPTGTKAEAQSLCGKYKSAGGNCFVSR